MNKSGWRQTACAALLICAATVTALSAQTVTSLVTFDGTNGFGPGALIQGIDGNLYGTTDYGGANCAPDGCGTIFKITPAGKLTTLYNFCVQVLANGSCADGQSPIGPLVQDAYGDFYGTTYYGGANCNGPGCGTIFKITPSGALTTLYSFCAQYGSLTCMDGVNPGALVQGADGNFYGSTVYGGVSCSDFTDGCGTVFEITPAGKLTTLHSFCRQGTRAHCPDGAYPIAGLIQGANGDLYGTTSGGAAGMRGTVFQITPSGALTTLASFDEVDGFNPDAPLVQAAGGNLYGITFEGGAGNACGVGCGIVFQVTLSGTLTTLYSFGTGPGIAAYPTWLAQGTDGNLYGTTQRGVGKFGSGSIFRITPSGALTTLYSFDGTDGGRPVALAQATNGDFYGTTFRGGPATATCQYGCGTVFSLSVGLGPFAAILPTFGNAGAAIKILGTNLTGATRVMFNGVAATFKITSATEITATVPTGASTGPVQVVMPTATLSSNVPFRVQP